MVGRGFLLHLIDHIHSHSHTHTHSVGLLWTRGIGPLQRQAFMPAVEFEPAVPASERPQTYTLDRAATGVDCDINIKGKVLPRTGHEGPEREQM